MQSKIAALSIAAAFAVLIGTSSWSLAQAQQQPGGARHGASAPRGGGGGHAMRPGGGGGGGGHAMRPGGGPNRQAWRGGGGYRGGDGFAAGVIGGLIAAPFLAAPYWGGDPYAYDDGGYVDGGYVEGPAPADAVGYCMSRFKSYDPNSGTYLGYDGLRHPCP